MRFITFLEASHSFAYACVFAMLFSSLLESTPDFWSSYD